MAKHKRKPAKAKPLTSHPLFPAVVALWFGALFGLGSLAIRPTLLESLVVKSHVDLVIPAAAPPLGLTARLLLALILAALGALVGAALARRIARPKPEQRARKRNARSEAEEDFSRYVSPYSTDGQAGDEGQVANRRRALAIKHEEGAFVPHDMAPLPGGQPQILDIAGMDLGAPMDADPSPLDLSGFAEAAPGAPVEIDWTAALPVAAAVADEAQPSRIARMNHETSTPARQEFQPIEAAITDVPAQPDPAEDALHGRQVFGAAPPAPPQAEARQIFGQAITDDHVSPDFLHDQGFRTTVFETEPSEPLFAPRAASPAIPEAYQPPAEPGPEPTALAQPAIGEEIPAAAAVPEVPPVAAAPAPAEPLPSPAGLGMTDLASRLAESMRRRRAARAGHAAPDAAPATEQPGPAIPQAYSPEAASEEPVDAAAVAVPPPYIPPLGQFPIDEQPIERPFANQISAADAPASAAPEPIAEPPAAPMAMPAALRPIGFGAEDSEPLDSLLPPRHIAMPQPVEIVEAAETAVAPSAPAPAQLPRLIDPVAVAIDAEIEEIVAEDAEAENAYGSLLGLTQSAPTRNPFVRIEEAEAQAEAIEPVVIFPGQAVREAAPMAPAAPESVPFRQFDAPANAGQGQMVASPGAACSADQEEAERALRAALANLQRMSGAA